MQPPSPAQLPACAFCPRVTERPGLWAEAQSFLLLGQGPVRAARWALLPEALGGQHPPGRKGSRSRRCPRGGGLWAGGGVCVPRMEPGAVASLFVTGVTPSVCPWGLSRRHPSAGEPRVRQGPGMGREKVTILRAAAVQPPHAADRTDPDSPRPEPPGRQLCPMSCPWPLRANRFENPASALHACGGQGLADLKGLRAGAQQPGGAQPGLEGSSAHLMVESLSL